MSVHVGNVEASLAPFPVFVTGSLPLGRALCPKGSLPLSPNFGSVSCVSFCFDFLARMMNYPAGNVSWSCVCKYRYIISLYRII